MVLNSFLDTSRIRFFFDECVWEFSPNVGGGANLKWEAYFLFFRFQNKPSKIKDSVFESAIFGNITGKLIYQD